MSTAPGAKIMAPSSPASRPSPSGDLRPALTPAAGGTAQHPSGADKKEDQQIKIRLTEVSTVRGDCHMIGRSVWDVLAQDHRVRWARSRVLGL
jgi:hypothetical protein